MAQLIVGRLSSQITCCTFFYQKKIHLTSNMIFHRQKCISNAIIHSHKHTHKISISSVCCLFSCLSILLKLQSTLFSRPNAIQIEPIFPSECQTCMYLYMFWESKREKERESVCVCVYVFASLQHSFIYRFNCHLPTYQMQNKQINKNCVRECDRGYCII